MHNLHVDTLPSLPFQRAQLANIELASALFMAFYVMAAQMVWVWQGRQN